MYTSDFDESDKKKYIQILPRSILTFNKCKKYVNMYWSKTEKVYSDLMYDSKEIKVFVFFSEVYVNIWFQL